MQTSNPVWVLPNIWRLRQVTDTKFGTKYQGYSFYRFWVIMGKSMGGIKLPTPTTQIRVNIFYSTKRLYIHCDLF